MPFSTMIWKPIAMFFMHLGLVWRVHTASPALDVPAACAHVIAAEAVASGPVTPELLLGVAFVESRFDATAVSRLVGRRRVTGRYPSREAPANRRPGSSLYCGPLQTFAASWSSCLAMRDLTTGYAAGLAELAAWMRDRRVRGDLARALAGHGCGNHGVLTGSCNGYPTRVLAMERRFRLGRDHGRARVSLAAL